ncbi:MULTISPECIES: aminodeoxychorismate lyase [Actinokineospora]|uniref:4-amino-4-deoxychorismate lyase n=1 Tax=Actinokineospora fastidiosa TaxID=1816 RepID=A0A918G757_9PSEU|nr:MULTISPECIES: aminodeoxychorismate lyase [Actinokineospora]UVS82472.1 D-alanine aminotransferase [Actinokineospora sp. UTMC 2448]GGS20885.1 4-amino-4-deoxychorismate lyase [Actinokineospora fastidiosa]
MRLLALPDGTTADPDAPHIRVDDLGLTRGDGVFETVLVVDGRPRELTAHLDRLERSARMLDLPVPARDTLERLFATVVAAWPSPGEMAVKVVCTRGAEYGDGTPTVFALAFSIEPHTVERRRRGASVVVLDRGFDPEVVERAPWLLLGAKTLSYAVNMAAQRHAAALGADEVIFRAADGSVLEGPTSTVVVAEGRTLRTPPASSGILPGTTQSALFRAAERAGWATKVEPLRVGELAEADGVFLVSSIRKIVRVHTLDGVVLPDATALWSELTGLYEAEYA